MELCETTNRFENTAVQLIACGVEGKPARGCNMGLLKIAGRINLWHVS